LPAGLFLRIALPISAARPHILRALTAACVSVRADGREPAAVRPIALFFALTYAVTWSCFGAAALLSKPPAADAPVAADALLLLGTFAPSLVAIGITAYTTGRAGVEAMLQAVVRAPGAVVWYVFAIGYMPAAKVAVALTYRAAIGSWPTVDASSWYIIPWAIVFSTPVQAGEEIGWRGFALPRLAERVGIGRASLVLGRLARRPWHATAA
jgi:uncharacterized protein